jgi:uncharacterized protein (DUF433 family)
MGLYTPQEAATFAKLRLQTFNRWFYGNAQGDRVIRPRLNSSDRIVTFSDLMQAVAVRTLRQNPKGSKVPLQQIREVVEQCEKKGVTSPLARQHTLYVFGGRLILRTASDDYIGLASGVDKGQLYQGKIIEPFLEEVRFGSDSIVDQWSPLSSKKYRISLDANRRFGLPIVEPGGVLVNALVEAVASEGSIKAASEAFEVDEEAVQLAWKYQEYLSQAA